MECVEKELGALKAILDSGRRRRVYRHHPFFRQCTHVSRRVEKYLVSAATASSDGNTAANSLDQLFKKAGRTVINELVASRIDTSSLSLALFASLSRLSCAVKRNRKCKPEARRAQFIPVKPRRERGGESFGTFIDRLSKR